MPPHVVLPQPLSQQLALQQSAWEPQAAPSPPQVVIMQ
jgi:hypothetical protein